MGRTTRWSERLVQAPRAWGISVESCKDGGVKDQASDAGALSDVAADVAEGPVVTVTVCWVSGAVAWVDPARAAVRAGTADAR